MNSSAVKDVKQRLSEENLMLVHSLAHKMSGRGIEYEELYSAGLLGLVKAEKGFDSTRGFMFSTYAVPVILGEMRRLFRDGGAVKIGRSLKELSCRASREAADFSAKNGRDATVTELASILGVSAEDAAEAIAAAAPVMSLTYSDDAENGAEADVPTDGIEDRIVDRIALREALGSLEEQDRKLIMLRYFRCVTQSGTGELLGMTQVQVSRREREILRLMKERLA